MFGKLSLAQKKAIVQLLVDGHLVDTVRDRIELLDNSGLGVLRAKLPLEAEGASFAMSLVNECERLGTPPSLGEYATVLLAKTLREELAGSADAVALLTSIIAVYVPDHARKYPTDAPAATDTPSPAPNASVLTPPIKILFLAANPKEMPPLQLETEKRLIAEQLRDGDGRRNFDLEEEWELNADKLMSHLMFHIPSIVHFMGHGAEDGGVYLTNSNNQLVVLDPYVFADLFDIESVKAKLHCIVVSACWGAGQAKALKEVLNIPYVIGMKQDIPDRAARAFARGFYLGLSNTSPMSVPEAFKMACAQMGGEMNDRSYREIPSLFR